MNLDLGLEMTKEKTKTRILHCPTLLCYIKQNVIIWTKSQIKTSNYLTFTDKKTCSFNTVPLFLEHGFLFKFPTSQHFFWHIKSFRIMFCRLAVGDSKGREQERVIWAFRHCNGDFVFQYVYQYIYIYIHNYNYWLIHYLQSFESDTIGVKLHSEEWNFLPLKAPWSPAACNASKATNGTSVLFWCKIGGGVDGTNLIEDMKADIWVHEFFTPLKKPDIFLNENSAIFVKIQVWIIEVVDWPWWSLGILGGNAGSCQTMSTLDNSNMLDQSFDLYFKHD